MGPESALDAAASLVDLCVRAAHAGVRDRLVLETGLAAAATDSGAVWRRAEDGLWRLSVERGRRGGRFEFERAVRRALETPLEPKLPGASILRAEFAGGGVALVLAGRVDEATEDALDGLLTGLLLVELAGEVAPGPQAPLPAPPPVAARLEHDVRNALTSLLATREVLDRFGADLSGAEREAYAEALDRECERTGALVAQGLTGRPAAGPSQCVVEITHDVLALERAATEAAGCILVVRIAPECRGLRPETGPEGWSRIVRNLVVNARQAAAERALRSILEVGLASAGGVLELWVEDRSGGLPDGSLAALFEAGFRHGKPAGSGLGLAVVRDLVGAAGGGLAVERRPTGARFSIWMPTRPDPGPSAGEV